jgi:putative phosphoesterase
MKIAIISDIHSNLPALEAVLQDIDSKKPDMIFCLGDLVGYAPWPNEVIQLIRSRMISTIAGNYDEGVGNNSNDCGCAYKTTEDKLNGEKSIAFTNKIISEENRSYLKDLPVNISLEFKTAGKNLRLLLVHGSPRKINEYLFEDRPDKSFLRMMSEVGADIMLFGHTHKPFHKKLENEGKTYHAINTGSVGKPKDGDNRTCYVIIDLEQDVTVDFIRVEYDFEKTARAIEGSSLPDKFADQIRKAF